MLMKGNIRLGMLMKKANVAVFLQRKHCRQTLSALGKSYNITNYSSVSSVIERVKTKLLKDRGLKDKINEIEKNLNKGQEEI